MFSNVQITSLARVLPEKFLTSRDINTRLANTHKRLGLRGNVLENVAGIHARGLWNKGTLPSQVAAKAGQMALEQAGLDSSQLGLLINTSVSRDWLEPSTASIVGGMLGIGSHCQNFDVSNACLGFINGMDLAARMIETGQIEHALVVNGETAEHVYEATLARLESSHATHEDMLNDLAALTLGSGAAAMVLSRAQKGSGKGLYMGGVSRSATQWNELCRGNIDRMTTDSKQLLEQGIALAKETFRAAQEELDWNVRNFDAFAIHQVSEVHTKSIMRALRIRPEQLITVFPQYGNIGPASVPIALSKLMETKKIKPGSRVGLLGIGSGLNCTMAEVRYPHT